jgi:cobalt-zinc-cadmium efflux system outer membrane protein
MLPSRLRRALAFCAPLLILSACSTWQRQTPNPQELLRELEAVSTDAAFGEQGNQSLTPGEETLGVDMAAAVQFAVRFHPELRARRAAIGVHEALIVEAGTLPDISVGWSAMDVLATKWVGNTPTTENYLSGLGVMWRLPRPGEWPARSGIAEADRDAARAGIVHAEWMLASAVRSAYIELAAARAQLSLSRKFQSTVQQSADWFAKASKAGTATALQAELAGLELSRLRQDLLRYEGEAIRARQRLCALMGLPPTAEPSFGPMPLRIDTGQGDEIPADIPASELVQQSLGQRPDLLELLAQYEAAEQAIRLEVSKQWPEVSIGTGIEIMVGLFRGFDNPAIDTARARRAMLAEQIRAAVHEIRAEIHETRHAELQARRELEALEEGLLPAIERSVELSARAFSSGAVSFAEILEAQRQVLEARRRHAAARSQLALRRVQLLSALGRPSSDTTAAQSTPMQPEAKQPTDEAR